MESIRTVTQSIIVAVLSAAVLMAVAPTKGTANEVLNDYSTSYYAVIVGVADYPGSDNDLDYTDDDAIDMTEALQRYSNWEEDSIALLLDSDATAANIEQAIAYAGSRVGQNDVVLFYFSGHGTNKADQEPYDEEDGRDEFLCAYDTDISDDQVSSWFRTLPTKNVVVIIDTCYSGGLIEKSMNSGERTRLWARTTAKVRRGDGFAADFRKRPTRDVGGETGYVVLTACDDDQLSVELSSLENGLFTFFVLAAINSFCDFNRTGTLSAEEVSTGALWGFRLMYSRNPSLYSYLRQTPQYHDGYPLEAPLTADLAICY